MKRRLVATAFSIAALLGAGRASATAPYQFGPAPRSTALGRADVADVDPTSAAVQNAAAAWKPGTRVRIGYDRSFLDVRLDGRRAPLGPVAGLSLGAQLGGLRLPHAFEVGLAIAARLPDDALARITFQPATEPQPIRYGTSLQRATVDVVGAIRRGPFSLGVGAAMALEMGGQGVTVNLGQDALGTYADGSADVTLAYRIAPIVGLLLDLDRFALGLTFRGALGIGVEVRTDSNVMPIGDALSGTAHVTLRGQSAYDPARLSLGGRLSLLRALRVHGAVEWQGYGMAPPPGADVALDVRIGPVAAPPTVRFPNAAFRSVFSPRLGLEWVERRWAIRAGYVYTPSAVRLQSGYTSYADTNTHALSLGGALGLGRVWGMDLRVDVAGQLALLSLHVFARDPALFEIAQYTLGGRTWYGTLALEAAFR